jgi:hypothetical protein
MVLFKSFAAGVAGLLVYAILIGVFLWLRMPRAEGLGAIAVPIRPLVIGALLVFATAFYLTFKRSS